MDPRQKMRAKALELARSKVKEAKQRRDYMIIQAIEAIDELDDVTNLMMERVRNWYAHHYPELVKLVRNPDTYLDIITGLKERKSMRAAALLKYLPEDQAKRVEEIADQTIGADVDIADLDSVAGFAALAAHGRKERNELADYIEKATAQLCPNVHSIAGGLLTARLLAKAGSLEAMAEMPASKIQILGAEKAMFAHIKKGVAPPKHGVIFAYPYIQQSPRSKHGKIARLLAGKLAIAARMDFFGHGLDPALNADLVRRVMLALKAPDKKPKPSQAKEKTPFEKRAETRPMERRSGPPQRRFDGPRRDDSRGGRGGGPRKWHGKRQ